MATALPNSTATGQLDPADDLRAGDTVRVRLRTGFDRVLGYLLPLLFLVAIVPILDLLYSIGRIALPTMPLSVITSFGSYQAEDALGVTILSTFEMLGVATAIAVGLGVLGGIATAEFLSDEVAGWVRTSANLLAGMPSVIVGFFGFFALVLYLGWGAVFIAGAVTLSFFMMPYVFRTADIAFSSIPRPVREAAYGSGARPYQYILRVGLPIAIPQILTGVFLAMAIGLGETAPIILTVDPNVALPISLYSHSTYLTYLIYVGYESQPGSLPAILAFQAALLVVAIVVVLNIIVRFIAARYRKRLEGLYQ